VDCAEQLRWRLKHESDTHTHASERQQRRTVVIVAQKQSELMVLKIRYVSSLCAIIERTFVGLQLILLHRTAFDCSLTYRVVLAHGPVANRWHRESSAVALTAISC
jgi:hypothetical protein